ncbi:hypothetical protein [uncultured Xylophilus sp.]|uniref:hypothetical protein n=1 Tax=uncultured Xylophilus sp. TaxID=296832 RepID=UPI0025F1A111|nr:hypothetical protein [uncultured Xylophilus sp.]
MRSQDTDQHREPSTAGANRVEAVNDAAQARERNGHRPDRGGTGSGAVPGTSGSGIPPEDAERDRDVQAAR